MTACPSCGQENPPGFRYCGACGTPLAGGSDQPREERKVVTVLFCDIVGSTERAERMDPEDVRGMLRRYQERVRGELERFGGTVEKFIGDAVMALFGAPVAHEDDPERAVRAALAILRWATDAGELQVRVGITTGEALVTIGARPELGEGMAAGDVVNAAARLQAGAPVNAILVDEATQRASRDAIAYREADPVVAKGKREPIRAWEALAVRSRLGSDVGEATATPLVGRAHDLELLVQRFERTRRERVVELVTLVGEPGIGKSRLVQELLRRLDADPELIRWRQGRCLPYGEGVALWALGEIVKAEAGVMETDSADEAATKLDHAVRATIPDAGEATWVQGHLRPLVGLAGEGTVTGERRDEAFAAWRRFLEGVAEQHPLVLVFEDLHWADDTLIDFVDHLVDWATDVPMLVVVMARPELLARRPGWGGGKSNAMTHSLPQLSDEETASLVHALLGRTVMPAETQQTLVAHAGGNPLYAEEFARMLGERGEGFGGLPESVQGIIAARLDALDSPDKALLQDAAVLGKVFWIGAVGGVAGERAADLERRLHELERRELIRRDRASAVAGERQYAFRHVLVRDVAYAQIPRAQRAEKHAAAATWIEGLAADRSEDRAEMLAHHWAEAMRFADAAGRDAAEYVERASAALIEAADRALGLNAASAAAALFEQALGLIGPQPPADVLLRYGRSLYLAGDERASGVLERARDALADAGDRVAEGFAEAMLSHIVWLTGDTDTANRHVERAVSLVEGTPPSEMKAHVLARAASRAQVAARDEDASRLAGEAVEVAESLGLGDVELHALTTRGSARLALQDMGGLEDLERAYELARQRNSPEGSRAALNFGVSQFLLGDVARYRELHTEGLGIAERFGLRAAVRFAQGSRTSLSYFEGDWDGALAEADAFLAASATEPHYQDAHAHAVRAAIRFARDDVEGALAEVEPLFSGASDPQSRGVVLAIAARVFLELGHPRALDTALEVVAVDFGTTAEPWSSAILALIEVPEPVRHRLRANVERQRPGNSRWMTASRAALDGRFAEAADIYAGMPFMPGEAEARLRAAESLFADGRPDEARAQLDRAISLWHSVGAVRYLAHAHALRDRFAA